MNALDFVSVIISTYNSPEWLKKVLFGYQQQSYKNFEVVIADDGSLKATFDLIEKIKKQVDYTIKHVWHKDNGFQKCTILNKAILASSYDYLIFSDGDCLPKYDFIETHVNYRKRGYFLSGGYFKLPMQLSKLISLDDINSKRCFSLHWLKEHQLKKSIKNLKLINNTKILNLLNNYTPTSASWNGHNASAWKKDLLSVNGFDERMKYGGEDRELGERLWNYGIQSRQIRYKAICLHLDHSRGYVNQEAIDANLKIRKTTKELKAIWTDFGIQKTTS